MVPKLDNYYKNIRIDADKTSQRIAKISNYLTFLLTGGESIVFGPVWLIYLSVAEGLHHQSVNLD
jgi:hypothetical protein